MPIEAGGFYSRKYGIGILSTQLCKGFCVYTTQLNTAKALLQIHTNHQHQLVLSDSPFKPIWFVCRIDSFSETERSTSAIKKQPQFFFRPQSSQSFIFHSLMFFGRSQKNGQRCANETGFNRDYFFFKTGHHGTSTNVLTHNIHTHTLTQYRQPQT